MNKEQFSKLLHEQLETGRSLISLVSTMHESQNDFGDGMALFGGEDLYYVPEEELEEFTNKFSEWKSYVSELLKTQFSADDQFVYDWDSNVGTYISKREPILPQLKKKVNKGVSLLNSFLERLDLHFHDNGYVEKTLKQANVVKTLQVFISHASKDKDIIGPFKNFILKQALGLKDENIICTSFESTGVAPGENIPQYIKDNIAQATVFLSMISNNYKASEVCMNEVGAALALDKKPIQVVLPGVEFTQLGWLIHLDKASKIDNGESLDHLAEVICDRLGIPMLTPVHWNEPKKLFLDSLETLSKVEKQAANKTKPANVYTPPKGSLQIFDISFTSLYLTEGEYIIQLNVRLRSDVENISLRHVYLRNKNSFTGSVDKPLKELEFRSCMSQGIFELVGDKNKSLTFVRDEYPKERRNILDMTVEKGYTNSISFVQYFYTIRQCDGYDELQLNGWSLVVEYNVDGYLELPLDLKPVDVKPEGKYWHDRL